MDEKEKEVSSPQEEEFKIDKEKERKIEELFKSFQSFEQIMLKNDE